MQTNTTSYSGNDLSIFRKINLIFRFSYTIPFFLASVCGILYALPTSIPAHLSVLIPIVVLLLALLVNFSNDYFDHMSGVDSMVAEQRYGEAEKTISDSELLKKVYWEGNQFDTGLVTESQGRGVIAILVVAAVVLSIPILMYSGWIVLLFGAVGLVCAYYYTAPPINFGARGLGEVTVGISFFMMCFCSYYVVTGTFDIGVVLFSTMLALVVGLMRLVDSMSAYEAHKAYGERCISVRLGIDGTIPVVKAVIVIAYAIATILTMCNIWFILLLVTLPMMAGSWKAMNRKEDHWEVKVIPAFFGFSLFTELLFMIAVLGTYWVGTVGLL